MPPGRDGMAEAPAPAGEPPHDRAPMERDRNAIVLGSARGR